eukprot:COSAG02_NODE_33774_length_494_cov_4.229342_1_plen_39_part_10
MQQVTPRWRGFVAGLVLGARDATSSPNFDQTVNSVGATR